MDATFTLLELAGAVALLLWGVHMVQSGVQRAFGPGLKRSLGSALRHRLKAFAAGLGVTALLQSSTATGLMAASFAAAGVVGLVPALAVMLGANVGTTLIVQVLSFDVARVTPVLILIGVVLFRRGGQSRTRDLGRVAIGLGLMLLALSRLLQVITPYEDVPSLRLILGTIAQDPIIDVLFGALLTWLAHSSVAVVLLVVSFAVKGVIPLDAALALTVGANIGTALNPVLEGAAAADIAAKRVAIGNLALRFAGGLAVLPCLRWIAPALAGTETDLGRAVANFHTAFNLALAAAFLPLLTPFAALLKRWLPDRIEAEDPSRPVHLDLAALATPPIALGCAAREALRMADVLDAMIRGATDAIERGDRRAVPETQRLDDVLDRLNGAIKGYLMGIDPEAMSEEDDARLAAILAFAIHVEHAGDILDRNVMAIAGKQLKRGVAFPKEGREAVRAMLGRLEANLRTASAVLMSDDARAARVLADEKARFRDLEAGATRAHFKRLREARAPGMEVSAIHLDLLRDLKRVNDHLVAGAAYPILEGSGELRESRLRTTAAPRP